MEQQPAPPQPSRLEAARGRVVVARWVLAVAAGAGFGWALLGAKLANPGSPSPDGAEGTPATETGAAVPASAPGTATTPGGEVDPDELLDGFFGDGSIAPDEGAQAEPVPEAGEESPAARPSRRFAPLPRTRAS